jgi:hypothetical protein
MAHRGDPVHLHNWKVINRKWRYSDGPANEWLDTYKCKSSWFGPKGCGQVTVVKHGRKPDKRTGE